MSENEKNVPKRRFKEFDKNDDWEQSIIGKTGYFYYGKSAPKWSVTKDSKTPCVRYGELYTKHTEKIDRIYSYTNIPRKNLKFSTGKEVLVPRVGEDPLDFANCSWLSISDVAIGEMISVYNTEQNPLFTAYMFNALLKYEFAKRVEGGNVSNLYYVYLEDIPVSFPSIDEQEKITTFLTNISNLITLHQRKLEKMKALKKAYLTEMFPAEGECKPKLRFAGFTDDWEQCKFENAFTHLQNNSFSRAQLSYEKGEVLNVHYGDILVEYGECLDVNDDVIPLIENKDLSDKYLNSFIENGDIIIADAAEDEIVGKCCEIKGLQGEKMISGLHTIPCRPSMKFATGYLGYYMNSYAYHDQLLPLMQGTKVSSISKSALTNTFICYPRSIEEQEKIGAYFIELDNLITLHQRKLDKLQNIKKAYLNEMFI
ncbi:restriction endonuclease subunit S [Vallitalea guaymasensis]|uniref:Restriction endonuclease subunit S n=1 Tax=Vallitalea guaymasensis TaxID=1185412 RepID=A0A8J8SDW8_9FIRM|nr:restriction endonuclease subunit S [Vallitalea guaymasensis]QUH31149.1 restriction endonuclease subunit S [Vallitalea guaymasensis]